MGKFKKKKTKFVSLHQLEEANNSKGTFQTDANAVADEKIHEEAKLPEQPQIEIPSLESIPDEVKKFLNLKSGNIKPIYSKKTTQVMNLYKKSADFHVSRKVGDRSHCPCPTCKAKYPKRVAMASFSQSDESQVLPGVKLQAPGVSCASNALSAILYTSVKPSSAWKENDMNKIMVAGDCMHAATQKEMRLPKGAMLYLDDLIREVNIYNKRISLKDTHFPMGGNLFLRSDDFPSIDELVEELNGKEAKGIVIRYLAYCISVFKEGDRVYLFDSHARKANGMPGPDGRASLYQFTKASDIVPYLCRFIGTHCGQFGVREQDEVFEYIMVKKKEM